MSVYTATARIPAETFERVNRLLQIDSLEDMTDDELSKQGAGVHQCEGIYYVTFDDGSTINFDLCSGSENYWDDVTWTNSEDTQCVFVEPEFEIGDIEVDINDNTYIVKVVKD